MVDVESSTCVMSLACWKAIYSPTLIPSLTILKVFDGHTFHPYGIIPSLPFELGRKTISIEVEVVDALLIITFYPIIARHAQCKLWCPLSIE